MKKVIKIAIFLIVLFCILVAGAAAVYYYFQSPINKNHTENTYTLKIPSGTSIRQIANTLEENYIIRSSDLFYVKAIINKTVVKAGRYTVKDTQSVDEILNQLQNGVQDQIIVSIPEGLTISKIANLLYTSDVITSEKDFIDECHNSELLAKYKIPAESFEGYLFPDTYYFNPSTDVTEVVKKLVDNFFVQLEKCEISSEDPEELHNLVILASIVEKEYRREEEAPLIASVFTNRLKKHIGLESCATIVYILTEIEGRPHPDKVTYEDLKINSNYNTYKWAGLPAGPIANPGKIALVAAARPTKTNYYYFRVKDAEAGSHYFSTTLEEHAAAGYLYQVKK